MHQLTGARRALLLQGPMGSFFCRFGRFLETQGVYVLKINLNGGGWFFSRGLNALNYRGTLAAWPAYVTSVLIEQNIDRVYLFGDCRAYHREAIRIARDVGVRVFVFEEGYVRPNYITLEESGANDFSSLPRDPLFYLSQPVVTPAVRPAATSFRRMAWSAVGYYLAATCLRPYFWNYKHHKSFSIFRKSFVWCRSAVRKGMYQRRDAALTERLADDLSKRYFLAVLQVHNDFQVKCHSDYADVTAFIEEVIESFAVHAPADASLVLKHHPMDRGARHYGKLIRGLCQEFGIVDRVLYTHQIHLPTALDHSRGVVLINSTVGLSALTHNAPVKAMGRAVFNMDGLTFQKPLDDFWVGPGVVNQPLVTAFRQYLINTTQLNGSFFGLDPFATADLSMTAAIDADSPEYRITGARTIGQQASASFQPPDALAANSVILTEEEVSEALAGVPHPAFMVDASLVKLGAQEISRASAS